MTYYNATAQECANETIEIDINDAATEAENTAYQWEEIKPLIAEMEAGKRYPIEAFPELMKRAVIDCQSYGQQPLPIIANSALSSISVSVQGLVDVQRDKLLTSPVSLNLLSIAESGERKSGADKAFTQSIRAWEKQKIIERASEIDERNKQIALFQTKQKAINTKIAECVKNGKKDELAKWEHELHISQKNEPKPLLPFSMMHEDTNAPTLQVHLAQSHPSGGVFCDEGALVVGGHGMNNDNHLAYLGLFNKSWDGSPIKRERITTESTNLLDKRLTVSLMMQQSVINTMLKDGQAKGTGFIARFLITQPESTIGTRPYKANYDDTSLQAFNDRIAELLEKPLIYENEAMMILQPAMLQLSPEAKSAWIDYHNAIEAQSGVNGEFHLVKDVAAKSADNAARIAALFHMFENGDSNARISLHHMQSAIAVASWYVYEALRVFSVSHKQVKYDDAETVLKWAIVWAKKYQLNVFKTNDLAQHIAPRLRKKAAWQPLLTLLQEHYYIRKSGRGLYEINPMAMMNYGGKAA